ncbi:MAG: N-6 DNA methylase, partial [Euryarchaeota archaeon]|nr:N-6 DNA methylase [Euryarchaeota archaeon]
MAQTTLIPYNNKNLFSNYYLDKKVKTSAEWTKNDHIATFSKIKDKYDAEKASFSVYNEAQLIKHFLDPIFEILLYECEVEAAEMGKYPDFAFFKDKNTRDEAHKYKGEYSFYRNALAIGEAKLWDTELDGKPSQQLWNYLDDAGLKWGILTNGRKWRLYCKGNEKKRDEYYEIDLPSLLDSNDIEGFKYFFYFFRRDAFLELPEIFLEGVLRESEVHAKTIGNNLKENVYKAMKKIAEGFFGRPQNNLDRNDKAARERVQKNTMLLLYRLLFLLYAEDRNLLDLTNPKYLNNHSFRRIKKEVEEKRGRIEQGYDYSGTTIWDRLKSLFELINVGSEAIGEKEFHVPAYNGGLFDTKKNPELDEKWKIGDKYLAEADIVTKENEWVSLEKYNEGRKQKKTFEQFDEFSRARKGELYLATDKGERKATGSYYTPDYIVNYIVRNTIGAVVDEKWKETQEKNKRFIDATLSVKVLDPAMGSGHFLVGAVDFLAEKLLNAAQKDIEAWRLAEEAQYSDLDWARREVVAHCIYGVDLNPMAVELAKVSLWLKTISKDKPLSFLDHRLKCGNSLIGADLGKLAFHPYAWQRGISKAGTRLDISRPKAFVEKVVNLTNKISAIDDETLDHIKEKEHLFNDLQNSEAYQNIKKLADLFTSVYFGNEIDEKRYAWLSSEVYGGRKIDEKTDTKVAYSLADNKRFFHWELEFPEIFFEEGKIKENPGFDAVVGNPPYLRIQELQKGDPTQVSFFNTTFVSATTSYDIYVLFNEFGLHCLKRNGRLGMIQP